MEEHIKSIFSNCMISSDSDDNYDSDQKNINVETNQIKEYIYDDKNNKEDFIDEGYKIAKSILQRFQ